MNGDATQIDGGPAFPRPGFYPASPPWGEDLSTLSTLAITLPTAGMSLRAWFSGQALSAVVAADLLAARHHQPAEITPVTLTHPPASYAALAVRLADALLAELDAT